MNTLYFTHQKKQYYINVDQPIDISIPLRSGSNNPNCYHAEDPEFKTLSFDNFTGSVAKGGSCNYQKIILTPHGNGTHTECYGHISADQEATIAHCFRKPLCLAALVSLEPENKNGDQIISLNSLKEKLIHKDIDALIIRTLPNTEEKLIQKYTSSNPPYLDSKIGTYLAELNVQHLLVDLPSVDKEEDGGKLMTHKSFWNYPDSIRKNATITELIYVNNLIQDGLYMLNLQVLSWLTDASPSRPVIFEVRNF